jgi:UDP-glucuronate 4-epimerase
MKRIFITGIAGFIGFHLARHLKKRGDYVIGCDNFNTYYDPALKRKRAEILEQQGVIVCHADITDSAVLEAALKEHAISHFVHLAAQAGVRLAAVEQYVHSNLNGFVAVLELLRRFEGMPLIYASSSSVYGLNAKVPFSETDTADQPASFYGATKKSNEMMAHAYHHLYRIPCTGLRFFTAYGPWGRPDMAYYSFAKAIVQGTPIPLFGDGAMQRDFTYIDDIVQGCVAAIDLSAPYEIFNLGNHAPHSVLELVRILEDCLGKRAILAFHPEPRGEVRATFADISKAQKWLSFHPCISLERGMAQFIEWFEEYALSGTKIDK